MPQLTSWAGQDQVWLAGWLLNRQVVNASSLEPVGRVNDVVFDPVTRHLVALNIQSGLPMETGPLAVARRVLGRSRSSGYVTLNHIISLNGDIVIVDVAPSRGTAQHVDRMPHLRQVCELAIITLHGMCLGSLADVLVDAKGSEIAGYVVNPTKQAEALMMPLDQVHLATSAYAALQADTNDAGQPQDAATVPSPSDVSEPATEPPASDAKAAPELSLAHLRVIPATQPVRIGEALIMVFEEVEPLQSEAIVVNSSAELNGTAASA